MFSRPRPLRNGFTLIEMLVVIAIIGILAGILVPVMAGAREKGRQSNCISNQHQISLAIMMYSSDREVYPGTDWNGAITIDRKVFECPDKSDDPLGYGVNAYIHGIKPEIVSRASDIICTCDAVASSTLSADFSRHNKGAIFSRLDGSCKYARTVAEAGRFACGKFPILPQVVANGETNYEPPMSFVQYTGDATPTAQFIIAGPYGDGQGDGASDMEGQTFVDYITENTYANLYADVSPEPGDTAPQIRKIEPPLTGETVGTGGANLFKKWTVPTAVKVAGATVNPIDEQGRLKLENAANYNCQFTKRTTYACIYICYAPQDMNDKAAITVPVDWYTDDGGVIWLNGTVVGRTAFESNADSPIQAKDLIMGKPGTSGSTMDLTIPVGISYLLLKDCNSGAGGMKFKLTFHIPAGKELSFSNSL